MKADDLPISTDLVLIGGGHSHLFVLRQFGMRPVPGVRLTLITRDLHTPYSGMLPGLVAGHYAYDEAHVDLAPLARFAGARLVHAEASHIDPDLRQVHLPGRPPLDYDLLSVNIGSRPHYAVSETLAGSEFAVKPVDRFLESWRAIEARLRTSDGPLRLAVVGGGAGGVELALSLQQRARDLPQRRGSLEICLLTDRELLLPSHNPRVRAWFAELLPRRSIEVLYRHPVESFDGSHLQGDFTAPVAADIVVWVTQASAAPWLRDSGLELDSNGFIAVDACLQSRSHPQVFAAGDIAAVSEHPRPKSGVFAVRQGLPLAANLRRRLLGQPARPFTPQTEFLSLISTGDRYAIASRGRWALRGRWCWWLKDRIDRAFIRRFSELPQMESSGNEAERADLAPMRCGGCGSKVGSLALERVLARIADDFGIELHADLGHADDAAVIEPPPGKRLVQSVDHFSSFVDDPWLFGRIAANHALGDLFAMGVDPHSAQVIANVVYAGEDKQAQDLYQLMAGVVECLQQHATGLAGGHSGEAAQMSCGLCVNGFADDRSLMLKSGVAAGDQLVLTRALGSGVLFAAAMRGAARGAWVDAALATMLQSNRDAAHCLRRHAASACTDVTGFGLAGHLLEMARASGVTIGILPGELPLYDGALELAARGISSSLQPQNLRLRHAIHDPDALALQPAYPLLFDPQTAGGLLASLPPERVDACIEELHGLGYRDARIVARASAKSESANWLELLSS
ncbi:MAG: selenide, water dikinase SelD [Gammaproteobacteria bacterium]|nr:selenide, water dikinase SelD [Gammaproteobacteria bacterium]